MQWGTRQKTQGKSSTGPSVQILKVSPLSKSPEDFCRNVEQENGQEISGSAPMQWESVWRSPAHVSGIMEEQLMGKGAEGGRACSGPFLNLKRSWG